MSDKLQTREEMLRGLDRDRKAAELAKPFIDMMEALPSDAMREAVLGAIFERFCKECGSKQPLQGICQCWNDE